MNLLLDSHAFLWFCEGSSSLSATARAGIENPANTIYLSQATAWEVAIKTSLGKLRLSVPYEDLFPGKVISNGFRMLPSDFRHYGMLLTLPHHHRDPFDRLLIAQALCGNLTLVSGDARFPAYGVSLLW
jgi:PIN domain nuclease of toxin-antitoxin system